MSTINFKTYFFFEWTNIYIMAYFYVNITHLHILWITDVFVINEFLCHNPDWFDLNLGLKFQTTFRLHMKLSFAYPGNKLGFVSPFAFYCTNDLSDELEMSLRDIIYVVKLQSCLYSYSNALLICMALLKMIKF